MVSVHLKIINEGAIIKNYKKCERESCQKVFHRAVITAIHHNKRPYNVAVTVPQVGNSPSFAGVNFI